MARILDFDDAHESSETAENVGSFTTVHEPIGIGDGVELVFNLGQTPAGSSSVIVFLDGVKLKETVHYSISGSAVTFVNAPQVPQSIEAYYTVLQTGVTISTGTVERFEYRTLTGGEVASKSLTLVSAPAGASNTQVDIIGGTVQEFSVDFTVAGSTLSWIGLGMDGLVAASDKLRIVYFF